jgi:addiction module RelE/StbE family toxin
MKLRVSPQAVKDIEEIRKYICEELCNPVAAKRVSAKIVKSYKSLKDSPYIGATLDSVIAIRTDYRFLVCENYLIFYKVDENFVSVYRVINGRRDYCRQLFDIPYKDISQDE